MRPRATLLLLFVAAATFAFVYLYEIRGADERKEAEAAAKLLFPGVEAGDVETMWLTTSDGKPVEAVREAGSWRLREPLAALGDPVALDGMANALAEIASETVVAEPQPPEVYGLGEAARVVKFRAKGVDHALRFGKAAPVGSSTYASTAEAGAIYTIPTYRATTFQKGLDELRERRVLRFDRNAIDRAQIDWPGGGVTIEKRDALWRMVKPIDGPADEETVEKVLADASYLRAEQFVDGSVDATTLALEPPELTLTLTGHPGAEGGAAPTFGVEMGRPLPNDLRRRAVRSAEGAVVEVPSERLADFPRTVVAYRFKELARFPVPEAQRVELAFHPGEGVAPVVVALDRSDAGWTTADATLAPGKGTRLVAELSRLRAADIVSDTATPEELRAQGLSPPAVAIRVLGVKPAATDAPLLADVSFGTSGAKGIAARSAKSEALYRIAPELAEHLPTSLEAWRERFLAKESPPSAELPPAPTEGQGTSEDVFPPTTEPQGREEPAR